MAKNAAGIEIFNGFNIKYPEYSVVTPHTLQEFTIRTLTIEDEEKLKGSMLTPNKLAQHLNEVIYQCIVKKPDSIKTFNDFLTKLTIKDRDALMYGLYHVTYKDIHNYDVTCTSCSNINSVKVNFLKAFKAEMWSKDSPSILDQEVKVACAIAQGVTVVIRQPLLSDEANLLKEMAFATDAARDLAMQLLVIKRFEQDSSDVKNPTTIVERENIVKGYKQLPSPDKKQIDKAYLDNFGKYGVEVESIVKCQKCGNEETITIDLVRQFFRSIYQ